MELGDTDGHGESCAIGELAGTRTVRDKQGRSFAAHWVVEPGREENHTLVTELMGITRDATLHDVAVHLHPFAESLERVDLTNGESIFKSIATNSVGRIGLEHVDQFSSEEGIPLYKDHEYSLISIYENSSGEPQDAMAVMYMYLTDDEYAEQFFPNTSEAPAT